MISFLIRGIIWSSLCSNITSINFLHVFTQTQGTHRNVSRAKRWALVSLSLSVQPPCPGTPYVDQTVLKFQRFTCLCLLSAKITGMGHHTLFRSLFEGHRIWLVAFFSLNHLRVEVNREVGTLLQLIKITVLCSHPYATMKRNLFIKKSFKLKPSNSIKQ